MGTEIKDGLIAELERRVTDKILEPTNAELLKKLINNADNDNEAIMIAELGTAYKNTGLYFEPRLEGNKSNDIRYFKKNQNLSFHTDDSKPTHKLIIGDNYEALQNLLIQYKGQVDVIYIDPPYGKDSMGEFAETNYHNAITRDNLLSMLYPRLQLAKHLLSPEGLIFCSIDDKNQAYVKCLFDEIMEEKNFIACAPRKTGAGDAATRSSSELRKPFDYLLIYKKGNDAVLQKKVVGQKEYNYHDEFGDYKLDQFQASGSDATKDARPKLYYPIYLLKDGSLTTEKPTEYEKEILPQKIKGVDGRWMWKPEKFEQDKERFIHYDGKTIHRKTYYDENADQNKYQVEKSWIDGSEFRNANGTTLVDSILGKNVFNNPKPISLIEWCINLLPQERPEITILDFFAGSGSTGHAVLEMNKKNEVEKDLLNEGLPECKRTFIICQLNENLDNALNKASGNAIQTIKNQIELCNKYNRPHELSEITAERLRRIMTGKCYDGTQDFPWLKDNKPYGGNLDVYEIAKVLDSETSKGKTAFDVIDETLYGKEKFKSLEEKIQWVCENFSNARNHL